jgi:hypothetical protein
MNDRRRVEHVPFTDPVAVRALGDIEMDVVGMVTVGARSEDRRETITGIGAHALAERL